MGALLAVAVYTLGWVIEVPGWRYPGLLGLVLLGMAGYGALALGTGAFTLRGLRAMVRR